MAKKFLGTKRYKTPESGRRKIEGLDVAAQIIFEFENLEDLRKSISETIGLLHPEKTYSHLVDERNLVYTIRREE